MSKREKNDPGKSRADHHLAISNDRSRQFAREAAGRYSWNHRMPVVPPQRPVVTRQMRRQEEREVAKQDNKALRERQKWIQQGSGDNFVIGGPRG